MIALHAKMSILYNVYRKAAQVRTAEEIVYEPQNDFKKPDLYRDPVFTPKKHPLPGRKRVPGF